MSISVLDSRVFRGTFGTQAIRDIFSDDAYVKRLVEVEAALARAEAKVGVIPSEAATAITDTLVNIKLE